MCNAAESERIKSAQSECIQQRASGDKVWSLRISSQEMRNDLLSDRNVTYERRVRVLVRCSFISDVFPAPQQITLPCCLDFGGTGRPFSSTHQHFPRCFPRDDQHCTQRANEQKSVLNQKHLVSVGLHSTFKAWYYFKIIYLGYGVEVTDVRGITFYTRRFKGFKKKCIAAPHGVAVEAISWSSVWGSGHDPDSFAVYLPFFSTTFLPDDWQSNKIL